MKISVHQVIKVRMINATFSNVEGTSKIQKSKRPANVIITENLLGWRVFCFKYSSLKNLAPHSNYKKRGKDVALTLNTKREHRSAILHTIFHEAYE